MQLIFDEYPKYLEKLKRLLKMYDDVWFPYYKNIGTIMDICIDQSMEASYEMFKLARIVGFSTSTSEKIHKSTWVNPYSIQHTIALAKFAFLIYIYIFRWMGEHIWSNIMHGYLEISLLDTAKLYDYLIIEDILK